MPEGNENWRDNLPTELKDHSSLKDVKDVAGLAKQFVDTLSAQGQMIRVPGPDAGAEALASFHTKLTDKVPGLIPMPDMDNAEQMGALFTRMGRPESAEGYEHPEGVDATQMADFAALSHTLGLTKGQYSKMVGALAEHTAKQAEAASEQHATALRALKQEWGIVYEDNLTLVNSVMKGTGAPDSMMEMAANGKLDPATTKWLYEIGKQLGTEGINFNKDESSTRLAPAEALARANEIMSDRTGPYWDSSHPDNRATIQKVVDLRKAAAVGGLT